MVPIAHEQNIICSKTRLDGTTHEQTIICRQSFAGHVVASRPMERKTKMHRMIIVVKFIFCVRVLYTGFIRVLEDLESPGILFWHFPGLESPEKKATSPGKI